MTESEGVGHEQTGLKGAHCADWETWPMSVVGSTGQRLEKASVPFKMRNWRSRTDLEPR